MNAFEEAQVKQLTIHKLMDDGSLPYTFNWRYFSMLPEFEVKEKLSHGTGLYPVNKGTGEVCDCVFEWDKEGKVLLCTKCLVDGT